jgi:hypothetical protein
LVCRFAWLCVLAACGPIVGDDGGAGAETSSTADATTSTSTSTSLPQTTTASPTTVDTTSSVTTDATFGGDTSSSSDPMPGFIQAPDGTVCGPTPEGTKHHCSQCDLWAQDCPRGEKCLPWANDTTDWWNATRCSPIAPDAAGRGEPCTVDDGPASGVDSCDATSMCWSVDIDTLEGECVGFCENSENNPICTAAGTECLIANDGVLSLCLPVCDPLAATPCDLGHACHPADGLWFCLPDGAPVEIDGLTPTLCGPGSTAVPGGSQSYCGQKDELCCAQICDVTAADCAQPLQCVPVHEGGNAGLCVD